MFNYFSGGLPRANVMANKSPRFSCSNILVFGFFIMFAFKNIR